MKKEILLTTDFKEVRFFKRGKVRDIYEVEGALLVVSTDRISCFDVVLGCGIPCKGAVLTALSVFWFDFIGGLTPHHFITSDVLKYPPSLQKYHTDLAGRSMLVKKSTPLPVECIVRGYLSGSGWNEYKKSSSVCGIQLPGGLRESDKLPEVLFTPSTKVENGHDTNVDMRSVEKLVGRDIAKKLQRASVAIYEKASRYALERGIIIADTKFEFGLYNGEVMLIDEVLTPDSSRFWPRDQYVPGQPQPSFDKQFVRDYLEGLNWDKNPPPPEVPEDIIEKTSQKYLEAHRRLTGQELK